MTCRQCIHREDLEHRIEWLEGELGLRVDADQVDRLRDAFKVTPAVAKVILMLWRAKGLPVVSAQLAEALPISDHVLDRDDDRLLPVYAHRIRKALGADGLQTAHGQGYRLTTVGLQRIGAVLGGEG